MFFAASHSKGFQAQRWQFHRETEDRIEQGMCPLLEILKWEIASLHLSGALKSPVDTDAMGDGGKKKKALRPRNGRASTSPCWKFCQQKLKSGIYWCKTY